MFLNNLLIRTFGKYRADGDIATLTYQKQAYRLGRNETEIRNKLTGCAGTRQIASKVCVKLRQVSS